MTPDTLLQTNQLYHPIQPSVNRHSAEIQYTEMEADTALSPFIYCFWQLRTSLPLSSDYHYRVVSDGCIDIFFEMSDPTTPFIMGFCQEYTSFSIGRSFDYVGIRFYPGVLPSLYDIDARSLSESSQDLWDVLPTVAQDISDGIAANTPFTKVHKSLQTILIKSLLSRPINMDDRVLSALSSIYERHGYLDIATDIKAAVSPRQLRRLCQRYIGTTAKSFRNVVRFQYILRAIQSGADLASDRIYLDVGFHDQAHFIKQFKRFYGVTPSIAFS